MIRWFTQKSGTVFVLVFVWKLTLFIGTMQPVPFNDSFFYDGAVVNALNGGTYCNPQLALALPIAGTEVFAAYPPLYQAVLFVWMAVFGTSVVAAMTLHLVLFGLYLLVLFGIFRQLNTPPVWVNLAGLFLFVNTFHDRPDSLAILLGLGAMYGWLRGQPTSDAPSATNRSAWKCLSVVLVILSLCTSLQFGAIFIGALWVLEIANAILRREAIKWGGLLATILIPILLVLLVKFGFPRLWEGFREHARETPGVTGFHLPGMSALLKLFRTIPALCFAVLVFAGLWLQRSGRVKTWLRSREGVFWLGGLAASLAFIFAATTFFSANSLLATGYLQPLVVGVLGSLFATEFFSKMARRALSLLFIGLAAMCAVRAMAMTTWGVVCWRDVNQRRATAIVHDALGATPPGSTVAVSAAYLYDAVRHKDVRVIHSDWLSPPTRGLSRVDAVIALRPAKMILTQYDRHRYYGETIPELLTRTDIVDIKIADAARVPVPDASRKLQRVVQHISWAPVIVEFSWK